MAFPCSPLQKKKKKRRPSIYLLPGEIGIHLSVTHLEKAFRTSCYHLAELFNHQKKSEITHTVVSFHKHLSLATWIKYDSVVSGMITTRHEKLILSLKVWLCNSVTFVVVVSFSICFYFLQFSPLYWYFFPHTNLMTYIIIEYCDVLMHMFWKCTVILFYF